MADSTWRSRPTRQVTGTNRRVGRCSCFCGSYPANESCFIAFPSVRRRSEARSPRCVPRQARRSESSSGLSSSPMRFSLSSFRRALRMRFFFTVPESAVFLFAGSESTVSFLLGRASGIGIASGARPRGILPPGSASWKRTEAGSLLRQIGTWALCNGGSLSEAARSPGSGYCKDSRAPLHSQSVRNLLRHRPGFDCRSRGG